MKTLLTIIFFSNLIFAQSSLPPGWRHPNEKDIILDWKDFQKSYSKPYFASADFNGDDLIDEAWILFKDSSNIWGLFVFLKVKGETYRTIPLDIDSSGNRAQRMGISIVAPGEYQTACGKGYWECEDGETPTIILKYPSLDFFVFESANSFFFWNNELDNFRRIWISD
ncbi:MAG: hypothetical protein JXA06_08095 [Bacteroidetes bacterium]|nr:hypothetical protein [Bacteroidota bacterium]